MSRATIDAYFQEHPEDRDGVMKAHFAFHATPADPSGHNFRHHRRDAPCEWCGRSREQVRHDNLPGECQAERPDIVKTLRDEERKCHHLWGKAEKLIQQQDVRAMTGEQLATLHHTLGLDPSMLEVVLMDRDGHGLSQEQHDAYEVAYAEHRRTGASGRRQTVFTMGEDGKVVAK